VNKEEFKGGYGLQKVILHYKSRVVRKASVSPSTTSNNKPPKYRGK